MKNGIDTTSLAISAAVMLADAPLLILRQQSCQLADLVEHHGVDKQCAVDIAWHAAKANGLPRRYGVDVIQEIIADGFSIVPEGGA